MFRLLVFLTIVLLLGLMFAWVADRPGTVTVDWLGQELQVSLMVALTVLILVMTAVLFVWGLLQGIIRTPSMISGFFSNRRQQRGYDALSRGLIAASSGDVDSARSLAKESGKLLKNEPLVNLLATQTALLEGRRDTARANFQSMLENDNTRLVALRGLFLEAERQGEQEAARHYAEEAVRLAPSLPWAGKAKLRYQVTDGSWDDALETLESNRAAGLLNKEEARQQRAVLLTAKAMAIEPQEPETAKNLAKEAHKIAKDLVPAAVMFAVAASRLGDVRGATKVLEATWKVSPHPEIADAYVDVRSGDSVQDRLKRAKRLMSLQKENPEAALAVAAAAVDALEWKLAREMLEPVLLDYPTERSCLLMADVEEGEHGDRGRMRDWLARAVRANPDPVWTADGHVSPVWLPISPVTGELGAFEWKVPLERVGGSAPTITLEEIKAEPVDVAEKIVTPEAVDDSVMPLSEDQEQTRSDSDEAEQQEADSTKDAETEPSKTSDTQASETKADSETGEPAAETEEDDPNQVKFPLERRPDDPGVDPDKVEESKGFKLF